MPAHCKVIYDEKFKMGKGSAYNDYFWCNARGGVNIGERTLIGPHVIIVSTNHVIKHIDITQNVCSPDSWTGGDRGKRLEYREINIGNDVWIGARVTILAGATIPDKCVIGAGAIITESNSKLLKRGDIVVTESNLRILGNRKDYK